MIDFVPKWFLPTVADVPARRGGHGVPAEQVIEEMTGAGFEIERRIDDWPGRTY